MSKNFTTETQRRRVFKAKGKGQKAKILQKFNLLFYFTLCLCVSVVNFSCKSEPTDLRSFVPADALVYLETSDLGKTLSALTESRAFQEAAKKTPDFSALNGMQVAVAVTGFEASENQVTAENSVLNFKPRFVAIADTHTWNRYTLQFTEERLGEFVNETYGGEVTLDSSDKNGGKSFVWTAKDNRKVYAFVKDSRIFFSNDNTALEKSLAAFRGEADSLIKNEALAKMRDTAPSALAFGYIAPDGIAQISNLAGVSTAMDATEDEEGRSFIARVLPQILRGSVREVFWTATKNEAGIEDKYTISLTPENSAVVKETLVPGIQIQPDHSAGFLPRDVFSATRYNLQDPQIAWRSLLLVAGKNADAASAKILIAYSGSLLEPYGISDAETFLSAINSEIWTANFDAEGDKTVVVVRVKDEEKVKKSIAGINFKTASEKQENAEIWKSADGTNAAAFIVNVLILGDTESVLKCLQAKQNEQNFLRYPAFDSFGSGAFAVTYSKDSTEKIVEVLGEKRVENAQLLTSYTTETRFNANGIERKTVSPFGLIGRILAQFDD